MTYFWAKRLTNSGSKGRILLWSKLKSCDQKSKDTVDRRSIFMGSKLTRSHWIEENYWMVNREASFNILFDESLLFLKRKFWVTGHVAHCMKCFERFVCIKKPKCLRLRINIWKRKSSSGSRFLVANNEGLLKKKTIDGIRVTIPQLSNKLLISGYFCDR